jgi:hypothetical protein
MSIVKKTTDCGDWRILLSTVFKKTLMTLVYKMVLLLMQFSLWVKRKMHLVTNFLQTDLREFKSHLGKVMIA